MCHLGSTIISFIAHYVRVSRYTLEHNFISYISVRAYQGGDIMCKRAVTASLQFLLNSQHAEWSAKKTVYF